MNNILVSNLDATATRDALQQLFARFGTVERIKIMTNRETGISKGVAFVEMTKDTAAQSAIAGVNGTELNGQALSVKEARPQIHRGPGNNISGRHRK